MQKHFRTLFIFGAGGHGRELAWLASEIWPQNHEIRFLVDEERHLRPPVNGIPVPLLESVEIDDDSRYVVAIGDPLARHRISNAIAVRGALAATLIHPRAETSNLVSIGTGAVICAGTVVTTNVTIGQHVHVNIGATVSHDVTIGQFSTISPGVHISGHVHIGPDVFIGAGATVINGSEDLPLVIGAGATIAAGSCVIRSVPPGVLIAGVPGVQKISRADRPQPKGRP